MKTAGIIAEYNPFHTGHKYQIDHVKGTLSADYVVIAMSGDFVQRGTPALLSKYAGRDGLTCRSRPGAGASCFLCHSQRGAFCKERRAAS